MKGRKEERGGPELPPEKRAPRAADLGLAPDTRQWSSRGALWLLSRRAVQFEFLLYFFAIIHLFIQNFNIYRTNFYNYNVHLLVFTALLFLKRLVFKYFAELTSVRSFSWMREAPYLVVAVCIMGGILYLASQLFLRHSLKNFSFLCYPVLVYLVLVRMPSKEATSVEDISYTLRTVVYNSFECAYFAGFLPLKFLTHDYVYYDPVRCHLVVVYIVSNSFVLFSCHWLTGNYLDLYLKVRRMGTWQSRNIPSDELAADTPVWTPQRSYTRGTVVMHNGKYYVCLGEHNEAEPGLTAPQVIFCLLYDPARTHTGLILMQGLITASQLFLLVTSGSHWNMYALMLLFNYYIFWTCLLTRKKNLEMVAAYESVRPAVALPAAKEVSQVRASG